MRLSSTLPSTHEIEKDRRQKTEDRRVTPSPNRAQRKQHSLAQDKQNNASGANKSKKISPPPMVNTTGEVTCDTLTYSEAATSWPDV